MQLSKVSAQIRRRKIFQFQVSRQSLVLNLLIFKNTEKEKNDKKDKKQKLPYVILKSNVKLIVVKDYRTPFGLIPTHKRN